MTLNYKSFGSGPPLVVLHGLFGMSDNWQTFAKTMEEEYSVFCVDLRNHGRSPHDPEMNYRAMAEDIRIFLEEHWIYQCFILGHSMGGKVAMRFALDHPEFLKKAIFVDIAPKQYIPHHITIIESLESVKLENVQTRADAEAQLLKHIPNQAVRMFLLKNLKRHENEYRWKFNLEVISENYESLMAEITGEPSGLPSLFIRGSRSNYILPEDEKNISELFPAAEIKTIKDAGHWVHAEQLETFSTMVREFLAT